MSFILTPPIAQTGCFEIFAKYEILEPDLPCHGAAGFLWHEH